MYRHLLPVLCLLAAASAVTKIQTITIHSPTSGAALNPVGAAMNTKLHAKLYSSSYGQYNPYGGNGLGAGLAGYGGVINVLPYNSYGAALGGYGDVPAYQYGFPGFPGSYSVKSFYPTSKTAYGEAAGPHPAGYASVGSYPNIGGYPYGLPGSYPGHGNAGIYGSQLGTNQLGYNQGYISYNAVNKLAGYGS